MNKSGSTSKFKSEVFSFSNYTRGSVDNRTGSYNFVLPLAKLKGNNQMGPTVNLFLKYNYINRFDYADDVFGAGWSLGLTKYVKSHKTGYELSRYPQKGILYLRDGRAVHVEEPSHGKIIIKSPTLNDFTFSKLDGTSYKVQYKDGSVEYLKTTFGMGYDNVYYLSTLENEAGYQIYLEYKQAHFSHTDSFVLYEIKDMTGTVLLNFDIDGTNNYITNMNLFPMDNKLKSTFILNQDKSGCLISCTIPGTSGNVYTFDYSTKDDINEFKLLSQVSNFGRYKEEITYDKQALLPLKGPYKYLPLVSSYKITMLAPEDKIYTERHNYEYTSNNFTGYISGATWSSSDDVFDNIYLRDSNYTYGVTESLYVDEVLQLKKRQHYNKYHLLIDETIDSDDGKLIRHNYTYYGDTTKEYKDQVSQYTCLQEKITHYTDGTDPSDVKIVTEKTSYEYDKYGNVLKTDTPSQIKEYTYVNLPTDKNLFVRHIASVKQYNKDKNNSVVMEYSYKTLSNIESSSTITVIDKIKEAKIINGVKTYFRETDLDYTEDVKYPIFYLPTSQTMFLDEKQVSTEKYDYSAPISNNRWLIRTNRTTSDGKSITTSKEISTLNGLIILATDSTGVETKYTYDSLGRIISVTSGLGTSNETTISYGYDYEKNGIEIVKETSADGILKETFLDAFNNECLVKINSEVISRSYYNTLNQLLEQSSYDTGVSSITEDKKINIVDTNMFYYDKWGRNNKIEYSNGTVFYSNYDMIDPDNRVNSKLTEYLDYGNERNKSGNYGKHIIVFDSSGKVSSEQYTLGKDDIIQTIQYEYNEFNNLIKEIITTKDSRFNPLVRQYTYDNFNRILTINEGEQNSESGRKISYEYSQYTDQSLKISIAVNDKVIGIRKYDGLNRLVEEKLADNKEKTYIYDEGYFNPKTIITPRGDSINYEYVDEMNYIPKSINVGTESFSYIYDPKTALVSKQNYINNTTDTNHKIFSSYTPTYDEDYNLIGETYITDKDNDFFVYEYGKFGTLNSIKNFKTSTYKNYGYNEKGQLESIIEDSLTTNISYINSFPNEIEFNKNGDKVNCSFYYDEIGREIYRKYINASNNKVIFSIKLQYNSHGKIEQKIIICNGKSSGHTYLYDVFGRLTDMELDSAAANYPKDQYGQEILHMLYEYDDFDNIILCTTTFKDLSTNEAKFTYDSTNPFKLLKITNTNLKYTQEINLKYDNSGNIISMDGKNFDYDYFEKLFYARSSEKISYYRKDFAGRQYEQIDFNDYDQLDERKIVLYSDDKLFASINKDKDNKIIKESGYVGSIYNKSEINGNEKYSGLFSDSLGNIYGEMNLENASDGINVYLYTSYGYSYNTSENGIQYEGERLDTTNGLYHLGNGERAYDPILMRFLQPDDFSPFDGGGINPYTYCLGDPINFTDPSGHISDWGIAGIVLGSIGLLASIATFGATAFAAGGVVAALGTFGGATAAISIGLEAGSLATLIASETVSNSEIANNLGIASFALGLGAFITGVGTALGTSARPRMISNNRVLSGTFNSIDHGSHMDSFYSATFKPINSGFQKGSLAISHGNGTEKVIKSLSQPKIMSQNGKMVSNLIDAQEFAKELGNLSVYNSEGPLYLMSCGAGMGGRFSNAQRVANTLNRSVYAFSNKYTMMAPNIRSIYQGIFKLKNVGETINFAGWPTFNKIKVFNPM